MTLSELIKLLREAADVEAIDKHKEDIIKLICNDLCQEVN